MRLFKIIHALPKDGYKSSSVKSDMQKFLLAAIRKKSFSASDSEFGSLLINVSSFDIFYPSFLKFNNLSARNKPFSFCQLFSKFKSPLCPRGNSANEYTHF